MDATRPLKLWGSVLGVGLHGKMGLLEKYGMDQIVLVKWSKFKINHPIS